MSSRLRSLDSKISFFAFADIITAVSGVLIFIALLLATDLGRPTDNKSQAASSEAALQLQKILQQQAEIDAQNHRLQELLATAESAPDLGKIQADIKNLRGQLLEAQKKQTALAEQMTDSQAAIAARDKVLGLTDLKINVQKTEQEVKLIAQQEAKARSEMNEIEKQVASVESKLLKLRQRDGQLWLIPDKSTTSKEPILVTVAGTGIAIERFDHPDKRIQSGNADGDSVLRTYLHDAKSLDQYVVFLIRPSGIELFQEMVKSAREMGFDVGYDALEEGLQTHFNTPPAVDDPTPPANAPASSPPQNSSATVGNSRATTNAASAVMPTKPNKQQPMPATPVPAPPKEKGWWQKLLEWAGLA